MQLRQRELTNINIKEQKYCHHLGIRCIISGKRFKGVKLLFKKIQSLKVLWNLNFGLESKRNK